MSSGASVLSLWDASLAISAMIPVLIVYLRRIPLDRAFVYFTLIYAGISLIYMTKFGWLNFTATMRIFLKILYAYCTIKIVGVAFLHFFAEIVYKLALISIPLYLIQLVAPETMMALNGFLEPIIPQVPKGGYDYANSIIFTVNPWGLDRNSGFMWEPGAFASMTNVALFFTMVFYGFRINKRFIVLFLATISCFSTTGFLLLFINMIFLMVNTKPKWVLIFSPLLITGMVLVSQMEFIAGKLSDRVNNSDHAIESAENYEGEGEGISVGRIGSLILDWNDLLYEPLFGYGLQETERTQGKYSQLVRANGFSDYMVKFGMIGVFFLFYNFSRSFRLLKSIYKARGLFLGVLLIITLSFSNPLLVSPVFWGFQFLWLAIDKKDMQKFALHYDKQMNIA
ncbi:MAG: hypothetical protein AAF487_03335 [Bacteroidota bacterium]